MSASERDVRCAAPVAGRDRAREVSMSELLASCAAARAVSTPPAAEVPVSVPRERPADAA
ncbi:hypothetical protein [Streptomyces sp. cg35]|uniref:hypothetical protein n=1 Tax=Streptomyces sp. cg35 TaxID=3421650 RepID=UPI003D185DFA